MKLLKVDTQTLGPFFIKCSYLRSNTATWPVFKVFKRFPVEPNVEYINIVIDGFHKKHFTKRDVMIEFVNMSLVVEELVEDGTWGKSFADSFYIKMASAASKIGLEI